MNTATEIFNMYWSGDSLAEIFRRIYHQKYIIEGRKWKRK